MASWSIHVVPNTVRAVLAALFALVVVCMTSTLASAFAYGHGGLETGILSAIISAQFLPLSDLLGFDWANFQLFLGLPLVSILALFQGLKLFRYPDPSRKAVLKSGLIVFATALFLGLWLGDMQRSIMELQHFIR